MKNIAQIKKELSNYANSSQTQVVFFYWKKCPYCMKALPIYEKLKNDYKNHVNFVEYEVDELDMWDHMINFEDKNHDNFFAFRVVPTIIVLKNNQLIYKTDTQLDYNTISAKLK